MKAYNDNVIREVALKKFTAQKQRNFIACMAIMLTTFMIYTICSIGMSFRDSMERQEVQAAGVDADLLFAEFTDAQRQALQSSRVCSEVGFCIRVATLCRMETMPGINAGFFYADEVCRDSQLLPAMPGIQGRFPKEENEILIPGWFAKELGISYEKMPAKITLPVYYGGVDEKYNRLSEDMEMDFFVCGIYEDKSSSYLRNIAGIYVSERFLKKAPYPQEQFKAAAYLSLQEGMGRQELLDELDLEEGQELVALKSSYQEGGGGAREVFAAVLIVIVCGALIIYNVLSLSAAQDIRFLGQMKTLGVTKRQLKKYLRVQVCWLCLAGIPCGFALAVPVSVFVVPMAVMSFKKEVEHVSVSFSPMLFAGTALLAALTAVLGSIRPLRVAGSVSPILASCYVGIDAGRKERRTKRDGILSIAWRNVFRRKKSAAVVFLSLFLAIMIYFTLDGLLSGFSAAAFVENSMYYDLVAEGTYDTFSTEALSQIADIKGVASVEGVYGTLSAEGDEDDRDWLEANDPQLQEYCTSIAEDMSQINAEAVKNAVRGQKYVTYVIGIGQKEFERIVKACGLTTDYEKFRAGDIGIWVCDTADVTMPETAQTVRCGDPDGKKLVIPQMESTPVDSSTFRHIGEVAPNILISREALCGMTDTFIEKVNILLDDPLNSAQIQSAVLEIIGESPYLTIDSKQEKIETNESSFSGIRILGTAMSLILFAIGILNFINTIYAGILSREKELAMLECIGMSKKQVRQMLVAEGMFYMLVTAILVLTAGSVIYWQAYQAFTRLADWAQFRYPFRAAAVTGALLIVMAAAVPLAAYRSSSRESAIARLGRTE
ncbi:MAG: FtsX-like permease family protein [Eubacterium sp.]|nr:FtsX-like permease family protein [Eubacterium sp.]